MKITLNTTVNVEYELFVDGENGEKELMERATAEHPLNFVFGIGMMLPKFEQGLEGLKAGESFEFDIPHNEAYGEYEDEAVMDLDRSVFEINGKLDDEIVFEGNIVPLLDSEGNRLQAQIVAVTDTHVKVDLNHPLAGENLHFVGKVLSVTQTTPQELEAIFGDGCGCGGNCDCDDEHHHHDDGGCVGCGGH